MSGRLQCVTHARAYIVWRRISISSKFFQHLQYLIFSSTMQRSRVNSDRSRWTGPLNTGINKFAIFEWCIVTSQDRHTQLQWTTIKMSYSIEWHHYQWPSFSSRRCTDLEQSSAAYHLCSVTSCLLLSLEDILLRTLLPVITIVVPAKWHCHLWTR